MNRVEVEVGDIFVSSRHIFKVVFIDINPESPGDPYFDVEFFKDGRFKIGDGFTLSEARNSNFKLFKATEFYKTQSLKETEF